MKLTPKMNIFENIFATWEDREGRTQTNICGVAAIDSSLKIPTIMNHLLSIHLVKIWRPIWFIHLSYSIVIFLPSSSSPLPCIFSSSTQRQQMGNPSISLRFTIFLSLSLSITPFALSPNYNKPSPIPKATPSDLLNLLGSKSQASTVNPSVAKELKSCFKFLVPFHPTPSFAKCSSRRSLRSTRFDNRRRREEDELVWWPPQSVLELARLAVDSGGDPGAIHRALDPAIIPVSFMYLL